MTSKNLPKQLAQLSDNYAQAFHTAVENFCCDLPEETGETAVLEGFRQVMRLANAGHLMHLESDPAYPLLIKMQSLQRQMMLPCADAVYHYARLHGDFRYRLHGNRGSAYVFQIAIYQGSSAHYPDFTIRYDRDNFEESLFAAESELDLVLSREAPDDTKQQHWIPLPEGNCEIHIRQYYYDWNNELPAQLLIERQEHCYPPPPLNAEALYDGFERANSWLRNQSALAKQYVQSFLQADESEIPAISIPGAFEGTRYLNGHYHCQPDEAIILEVEQPQAIYWGFQLSNLAWEALDYFIRQTSINGHQAVIDRDGKFRAVICHRDPGVANWLDTGGRVVGLISGRYFKAETAPGPRLTKVPFDELSKYLPGDTVRVSEEARREALRGRLLSAHARLCSDQ